MKQLVFRVSLALALAAPGIAGAAVAVPAGRLLTPRYDHTATLLPNGQVLVVGGFNTTALASAELYDPTSGRWSSTGSLRIARQGHTATLLQDGTVLVVGGTDVTGTGLAVAEIYHPATGLWEQTSGNLSTCRTAHTATLLRDGRVLVVGGIDSCPSEFSARAELYIPASRSWVSAASLATGRTGHTATLLSDGRVVVAGGNNATGPVSSREIYDPATGVWIPAAGFVVPDPEGPVPRSGHTSTLLPNGTVLTVGTRAFGGYPFITSSEVYDPVANTATPTGSALASRIEHTATLLPDGRVLVAGGENTDPFPPGRSYASTEIFDPATGVWQAGPTFAHQRTRHTATLLADGRILLVGGLDPRGGPNQTVIPGSPVADAETLDMADGSTGQWLPGPFPPDHSGETLTLLPNGKVLAAGIDGGTDAAVYDPATDAVSPTGPLAAPAGGGKATLLPNGKVLLTTATTAQLYDPVSGTWSPTPAPPISSSESTATLLSDGTVLVTGGLTAANVATNGCQVYVPNALAWDECGPFHSLGTGRFEHTATRLSDGRVLVVGGFIPAAFLGANPTALGSAEILEGGVWRPTGALSIPRAGHTATLLPDGRVLVTGGNNDSGTLTSAEIFDPATETWTTTGSMGGEHQQHTATLLLNGKVLIAGGFPLRPDGQPAQSLIFDPAAGIFRGTAFVGSGGHSAVLLPDGRVLIAGGGPQGGEFPDPKGIYDPGVGATARRPVITSADASFAYGTPLTVTGTRFRGDSEASGGTTKNSASNVPLIQLRSLANEQVIWLTPDARPAAPLDEPMTLTVSQPPPTLDPGFHMVTVFTNGLPSLPTAGAASQLVGVTCSVAIAAQPVSQTVPIGANATFVVEALGVRGYQWLKNGLPIPGATAPSYTTPPISGADSGSFYAVEVRGACASALSQAAVLTVADSTPPTVSVVAPNGGEFWLLSPAGGPASVQQISWSMSDNVRVCRVGVSLEYSNDGGATFLPAPTDAALPASLGSGGSCAYPGVTTSSLSYPVASTYPSGRPGSLYRIRVDVTDQVGNTASSASQSPFYFVQSNPDVRTLILTNRARLESLYPGRAAALDAKLASLSTQSRVQGFVVDLTGLDYSSYDAAVAAHNGPASVAAANALLFGTGGVHDRLLSTLRAFPGVKYLVLVGDDRVIPFARLQDGTTLFDETNYPAGGDLDGQSTSVGLALSAKTYLSDDPLSLTSSFPLGELNLSTFLPDLTVGRLVETPEQMTTAIATFIGQDGILDLSALDPVGTHKVLVTGYDFFADSATQIRDRWKSLLGADPSASSLAPVDGQLVGTDWGLGSAQASKSALGAALCGNGGTRYGIASLSGHATHYLEGIPNPTAIDGLSTADLTGSACGPNGLNLSGGVVYAVGCHAGLPVPGSDPNSNHSLDLPETFLSHGVVAYVANSGYGWAAKVGPGYGKRLMEYLTETVAVPGTVVVGDGVRAAKLRYRDETPSLDPYDQKTLMQWTFYGLPMYAVKTVSAPAVPAAAARVLAAPRAPKAGAKPSVQRFGAASVIRSAAAVTAATAPLPSFLTQLDLRFDFSAPGVYKKLSAAGTPVAQSGCPDPNGCYYTLNGLASGKTDLPVQPYFVYDSRLSGTSQHGVLWLGGTFQQEDNWTPIVTTLVSNGGDASNHGVATRLLSGKPGPTRRVPGQDPQSCATSDAEVNTLVVDAGELLASDGIHYTTERHYDQTNLQALYFNDAGNVANNCDRIGPQIGPGPFAGQYHQVATDGTTIQFAVPASDSAGVWRVVIVVTDNAVDAQGRGRWQPVELADDGTGTWRGSFSMTTAGVATYVIQAVDVRGNVSWLDFVAAQAPQSSLRAASRVVARLAAAAVTSTLPASGVRPDIPLPVDVTLTGPAGPRVDSFTPTAGIVGAKVTIQGQNFGGVSGVRFDGTAADFIVSSPQQIVASVPPGAATGPISVTTPFGTALSSASFLVLPAVSVADATVNKPAAGSVNATFVVSLSFASGVPVTVSYATADATALAGTDYTATSGILTFAPGTSTRTVNVPVAGNGVSGAARTFVLNLAHPTNAAIARGQATGTILRPWRTADLNGDGSADILWQDQLSGNLAAWLMAGTTRTGVASFNPIAITDPKLQVVGIGDFNGDGRSDLVLQNQTTGALTVWFLNGTTRTGTATIAAPGAAWKVAAIADLNGDGKPDIVWQNATTNDVQVTFLNGTAPAGTAAISPTRPSLWRVRGAADWNSDGKSDLLWQNQTTGDLEVWFLNGTTKTGSQALNPGHPAALFALASVGDWNGDGKPDLLFRNSVLGTLQIWLMNGVQRTTVVSPDGASYPGELPGVPGYVIDPKWKVVAPR